MDSEIERRLARIEGKVNIVARAIEWVLGFVIGFGVYFLATGYEWALYYGFGAAMFAAGAFVWKMRQLEKRLPYDLD